MPPEDLPVWHQWRKIHGREYDYLLYDVRITTMDIPAEAATEEMIRMWMMNISKRLDAVAVRGNQIIIFEVTSRAFLRAIGQIIVYRDIWQAIKPMEGEVTSAILCKQADDDILMVGHNQDIVIQVI